jgi:hypothetical protein
LKELKAELLDCRHVKRLDALPSASGFNVRGIKTRLPDLAANTEQTKKGSKNGKKEAPEGLLPSDGIEPATSSLLVTRLLLC